MTTQEQARREAAFTTAIELASRTHRYAIPWPKDAAIARIQLYLCGHGDGTPGEFEEWMDPTGKAAVQTDPCFCACHAYPGTYPTTRQRPCNTCGHVHAEGHMTGTTRDGWLPAGRLE